MKVFYSSPWIPAEWLEAYGGRACNVGFAEGLCRNPLPLSAGVCAFSEAVLHYAEMHPDAAMIFTTACDQMRRSFDAFAAAPGRRGFLFNLPATWQSPVARQMFCSELERLGRFLQTHGGQAPTNENLAQIIERRARAKQRLLELAPRGSGRQFVRAIGRFHWNSSIDISDASPAPAAGSIPVAIIGGPLTASQWGVLDLIEAAGAWIVLNATETGERSLLPDFAPGELRGDPVGALVRHYFENIVDVFQRPNTRLYAWLGERLAARGARGIVLWVHTGCDLWRAEAQTLRETFRLPVLLLEADEVLTGFPREAGRIQAFVEMLR
jgi:hypothetical protein